MTAPVKEVHIPFTCVTFFLLNSWLTLNMVLTLYNKWLFVEAGFPFPLLVTTSHSAVGIVLGSATFFMKNSAVKKAWKQLLALSVLFCISITTGNVSLMYIHVSTFQLIKALTPVFQVGVSYVMEKRTYPASTLLLIPVICVGCCLALYKPPDWDPTGYALAFISAMTTALQSSTSAILMHDLKVDVFSAWLWNSIGSFFILVPFVAWLEWEQIAEDWVVTDTAKMSYYLIIGMALAMAYNICNYSFIRATSSVYTSIAGLVKVVLMIVLSYYFYPIQLEPFHIIGIIIVIIGFSGFSYNMFRDKQAKSAAAAAGGGGGNEGDEQEGLLGPDAQRSVVDPHNNNNNNNGDGPPKQPL